MLEPRRITRPSGTWAWITPLALLVAAIAGCDSPTRVDDPTPVGRYELVSFQGRPLPALIRYTFQNHSYWVESGWFDLQANGEYTNSITVGTRPPPGGGGLPPSFDDGYLVARQGVYRAQADRVELLLGDSVAATLEWRGDTLELYEHIFVRQP